LYTALRQKYLIEIAGDVSEVMRRRTEKDGVPPAPLRLASPHDPDARWAAKGKDLFRLGYTLHPTEMCEAPGENDAPSLITNVLITPGITPDDATTVPIHQELAERYLDSGPSVPILAAARRERGIMMITPLLGDSSRQAKTRNGGSRDDFVIDCEARTATCPQGRSSAHWNPRDHDGGEKLHIALPQHACWTCGVQPECTSGKIRRRGITACPREIHELQKATRTARNSKHWRQLHQRRAGIEGTMNQAADGRRTPIATSRRCKEVIRSWT
jgi:hypothetical protein